MSKDTSGPATERDCKHGQLARSCNVCELESEVARQAAEIEKLRAEWLDAEARGSEYRTEIERLRSEAELFAKHTGLALAAKDTLLRQALEAMQWEVGGEPLPTLMMESIAAIKQHLGES